MEEGSPTESDSQSVIVKRPAFQFYPKDWRSDVKLRSCSLAARGLWADLLCLMHDGDPYGTLSIDGRPIEERAAANLVGIPLTAYRRHLAELETAGVSSRTEGGVLYSRRMVRDEEVRRARAAGGVLSLTSDRVPRPKNEAEGPPEGHREGYPSTPSIPPPLGGSPAAAASSASASPTSKQASGGPAEARLIAALQREPGRGDVVLFLESLPPGQSSEPWARLLLACLDGRGMPQGQRASTAVLAAACRDYPAIPNAPWTPRHFRACVASAMREAGSKSRPRAASERSPIREAGERFLQRHGAEPGAPAEVAS